MSGEAGARKPQIGDIWRFVDDDGRVVGAWCETLAEVAIIGLELDRYTLVGRVVPVEAVDQRFIAALREEVADLRDRDEISRTVGAGGMKWALDRADVLEALAALLEGSTP